MEIRGRVALVTGATGRVGRVVARRLRDEGASVVLSGRRRDLLESLAGELAGEAVVADLGKEQDLRQLGELDVDLFVSAGGVAAPAGFEGYSATEISAALQVNLLAPAVLARACGERMLGRGFGHLVFVSSLAGKSAGAGLDSAGRFGVRGLALGLRQEWGPRGVGVSCVNVGTVAEPPADVQAAQPAGFRPRSAEDVAAAVVRVVRHDRAEVDVADPVKRAGLAFGLLAPQAAVKLSRLVGGEQ